MTANDVVRMVVFVNPVPGPPRIVKPPLRVERFNHGGGYVFRREGRKDRRWFRNDPARAFRIIARNNWSSRGDRLGSGSAKMWQRHLIEHHVGGTNVLDHRDPAHRWPPHDLRGAVEAFEERLAIGYLLAPTNQNQRYSPLEPRPDQRQRAQVNIGPFHFPIVPQRAEQDDIAAYVLAKINDRIAIISSVLIDIDRMNDWAIVFDTQSFGISETVTVGDEGVVCPSVSQSGQPMQR